MKKQRETDKKLKQLVESPGEMAKTATSNEKNNETAKRTKKWLKILAKSMKKRLKLWDKSNGKQQKQSNNEK